MQKKMLVILMCLISIVGCQNKYRKHISLDLAICASYAVPGMYCDDLKGGAFSYEIIEEDSYGRILYRFETINCLTEKEETVYVICQKTVSKYVYFYEDICYLFEENDNDDLMALKERNDWESELNTEKMSRRESMITFDIFIEKDCDLDYFKVLEAGMKKFEVSKEEFDIVSFLDADSEGKGMYLFSVGEEEKVEKYIAIVSTGYEISYMEAPDEIYAETFAEFKKENGWKYGW